MTKKSRVVLTFILVVISALHVIAQTEGEKKQIQKEAIQMRENLNKYLSDKLLIKQTVGCANCMLIDSVSTIISKQYEELEMLKKSVEEMSATLKALKSRQEQIIKTSILASGIRSVNDTILELYFAFDSYSVSVDQKNALNKLIGNREIRQVELSGYCDNTGTEAYNRKLSRKRCNAVKRSITRRFVKVKMNKYQVCDDLSDDPMFCRKVVIVLN